ncbi:MAG: hypothetical protein Q9161_006714 [Pseudevernia consocians]
MFYKFHRKSPWLKRVLIPCWAFQLLFMLALIYVFVWLRAYSGFQKYLIPSPSSPQISLQLPLTERPNSTNIVVLLISAVCTVLCVTEIILFATTRLHPLTYLILQLVKTIIWLVLFALAAVDTVRVQGEMKAEEAQEYSLGNTSGYFLLEGFVETLVMFVTFLAALIYASVVYHRHRRVKAHFLSSVQGPDLFPVIADEGVNPVCSHRVPRVPRNSIKETGPAPKVPRPAESKEAVEVTVLRELGGDWEVYELPATRSVRNSKGGKSLRSLKGSR